MSGDHDHPDHAACDHTDDVGAYLLHALPEDEQQAFTEHMSACEGCRREVRSLQVAVDALPLAAPQVVPPPALKDRIMAVVDAEAQLLRATGPEADRVPVAPKPSRRWGCAAGFSLRPVVTGALASAMLLVGVAGGVLLSKDDGPSTRTLAAQVADPAARVSVSLQGDKAALHVENLPSPPFSRVYQVWIKRGDKISPTHTLFNVRKSDGSAVVPIEESIDGVDQILVTDEPGGGSQKPTSAPLITATLS